MTRWEFYLGLLTAMCLHLGVLRLVYPSIALEQAERVAGVVETRMQRHAHREVKTLRQQVSKVNNAYGEIGAVLFEATAAITAINSRLLDAATVLKRIEQGPWRRETTVTLAVARQERAAILRRLGDLERACVVRPQPKKGWFR